MRQANLLVSLVLKAAISKNDPSLPRSVWYKNGQTCKYNERRKQFTRHLCTQEGAGEYLVGFVSENKKKNN